MLGGSEAVNDWGAQSFSYSESSFSTERADEDSIMPKLILSTDAQGKVAYEFAEHSITIGRASENMIVIDDPSVLGMHRLFGRDRHRAIRCISQF